MGSAIAPGNLWGAIHPSHLRPRQTRLPLPLSGSVSGSNDGSFSLRYFSGTRSSSLYAGNAFGYSLPLLFSGCCAILLATENFASVAGTTLDSNQQPRYCCPLLF
jgi:hypothetical protein